MYTTKNCIGDGQWLNLIVCYMYAVWYASYAVDEDVENCLFRFLYFAHRIMCTDAATDSILVYIFRLFSAPTFIFLSASMHLRTRWSELQLAIAALSAVRIGVCACVQLMLHDCM